MVLAISDWSRKRRAISLKKKSSKTISFGFKLILEFRKRVTRDKEVHRYAQDEVFKALLEVADNLDRATQLIWEMPQQERALAEKVLGCRYDVTNHGSSVKLGRVV